MSGRTTLKSKMQRLVLIDAAVLLSIVICAFYFITSSFKRSVRTETLNVFEVTFSNIENTLHFIDNIAFNTINDKEITSALAAMTAEDEVKYAMVDKLYYQLITRSLVANDAVSISVLDTAGNQFSSGSLTDSFTSAELEDIRLLLEGSTISSPAAWFARQSTGDIVYLRYIYTSPFGARPPDGVLTISMDMRKLLVQNSSGSLKNGNVAIVYNKDLLYLHNDDNHSSDFIQLMHAQASSAKKDTVFLKQASSFEGISYYGYEKLHNILPSANGTILAVALLIIAICAITFGATARLVHSITSPIEYLSHKMGKVEKGDFKTKINMEKLSADTTEIYDLALRFNLMTTQIEELVHNNYVRKIREKEYQLKALQAQINPHFLYNTLDSINWLAVGAGQTEISGMVQSLANLFREVIDTEHYIIPLQQELRLLTSYLTIQQIRLDGRLDIRVQASEECLAWQIPKLSLQPIVENSIKAGAERSLRVCHIVIKAHIIHERLNVSIFDDGCGMDKARLRTVQGGLSTAHLHSGGIGLSNIRQRIQTLCEDGGDLRIKSRAGVGTVVRLTVPKLKGGLDNIQSADS